MAGRDAGGADANRAQPERASSLARFLLQLRFPWAKSAPESPQRLIAKLRRGDGRGSGAMGALGSEASDADRSANSRRGKKRELGEE